jgi:glutamate--cysteine ligase regulatory subunit
MGVSSTILPRVTAKSNAELTAALRSNIKSARESVAVNENKDSNEHTESSYQSWTTLSSNDLYIPTLIPTPLLEDRSAYDITVKLFYLPNVSSSSRCSHTRDALSFVLNTLAISKVDLLIVSFPGITFDADDESSEEDTPSATPPISSSSATSSVIEDTHDDDDVLRTWRTLESLHDAGLVSKLGLSEFGTQRLSRVLKNARIRPSVDQINVKDCCVVPKPLIVFARQEKIELLTHNDCTDILPPGTLRELLGPEKSGQKNGGGAGVLAATTGGEENGGEKGLKGDVRPLWVIKYTAVVKNRGVVENKGYFACAEL